LRPKLRPEIGWARAFATYLGTIESVGETRRFGAPAGGERHPGLLTLRIAYAEDDLMAYGGEGGSQAATDVAGSHDRHPHLITSERLGPRPLGLILRRIRNWDGRSGQRFRATLIAAAPKPGISRTEPTA
jgi:hypothetical protein